MHVKTLKVFTDVCAHRSFSRAAQENGISQSNASQMVQLLEEHLGVKLLDRSKRPPVMTRAGEAFYKGTRPILQRYFALEEEVKTLHEEVSGRLRVASIYSVGISYMRGILQEFLTRHPKANVRLQYEHPDQVYEMVEADQADIGIVSYPRKARGLRVLPWRKERMVFVCAPSHPLAQRKQIELRDLHGVSLIGFEAGLMIRRDIQRVLDEAHVEVQVVMEFDNIETIKGAIEIDAGAGLLPEPTVEREVAAGQLVKIPLVGEPLYRPVGIVLRRGKEQGRAARRFLALLRGEPEESAQQEGEPKDSADAQVVGGADNHSSAEEAKSAKTFAEGK
jgi:DNA-binding transcriptional LysR family regulator